MKVFLSWSFAVERRADGIRCCEQSGIDDVGCRSIAAVACIDELDGAGVCGKTDQGQLEQVSGVLQPGFFEPEGFTFQRPENFLDSPPQPVEPVEPYDFGGTGSVVGLDRGKRAPQKRRAFAIPVDLARLYHGQAEMLRPFPVAGMARPASVSTILAHVRKGRLFEITGDCK